MCIGQKSFLGIGPWTSLFLKHGSLPPSEPHIRLRKKNLTDKYRNQKVMNAARPNNGTMGGARRRNRNRKNRRNTASVGGNRKNRRNNTSAMGGKRRTRKNRKNRRN